MRTSNANASAVASTSTTVAPVLRGAEAAALLLLLLSSPGGDEAAGVVGGGSAGFVGTGSDEAKAGGGSDGEGSLVRMCGAFWGFSIALTPGGMVPEIRLPCSSRFVISVKSASSVGIVPESRSLASRSSVRLTRQPHSEGSTRDVVAREPDDLQVF